MEASQATWGLAHVGDLDFTVPLTCMEFDPADGISDGEDLFERLGVSPRTPQITRVNNND